MIPPFYNRLKVGHTLVLYISQKYQSINFQQARKTLYELKGDARKWTAERK